MLKSRLFKIENNKKDRLPLVNRFLVSFLISLLLISNIPINIDASEYRTLEYSDDTYNVVLTYDEESSIPDGSSLHVEKYDDEEFDYDDYVEKTKTILEWEDENFSVYSFINVYILDKDGNIVIPQNKVKIKVNLVEDEEKEEDISVDSTQVVVINEEDNTVINGKEDDAVVEEDTNFSVVFDNTDDVSFPVIAVAQTVKEKTIKASDDNTYLIKVVYDSSSEIPLNAEIEVEEVNFDDYLEQSVEKLDISEDRIAFAYAFDIRIVDPETGEEYQPKSDVKVSINLLNEDVNKDINVEVLHLPDYEDVAVLDTEIKEDAIEFVTDGFSVYAVLGTTIQKTLTASDGKDYRITVFYDDKSGIPADAQLFVKELNEDDESYDEYLTGSAEALDETPENLSIIKAFDITLKDPVTDEKYQPDKKVKVSIELLDDKLNGYDGINVIHFPTEGNSEAEIMDTTSNEESIEFKTDGFSVYVLTKINEETGAIETVTPICTYTFYVWNTDVGDYTEISLTDDQGNPLSKQAVKNGNELVIPQMTSTDTQVFAGWYEGVLVEGKVVFVVKEGQTEPEPYDFDHIVIEENSAVDLYAVYKTYANIIFHDQFDNEAKIFPVAFSHREEMKTTGEGEGAVTSATVKITDFSTTYTSNGGPNMSFLGWSETAVETPGIYEDEEHNPYVIPSETITVTGEKHLYPIFKEIHWLTYYTAKSGMGADYVAPAKYFIGDPVPTPLPVTAMDGYNFLGWWTGTLNTVGGDETVNYGSQITDAAGNLVATADDGGVYILNGKLYLRSDATLYAKWEAKNTADYRIVIWTQNPSDVEGEKTYEYRESDKLSATIGTTVSVAQVYKEKNYNGYTYTSCDNDKIVDSDGSTILNVYYDKNDDYTPTGSFTLKFVDSETTIQQYDDISYGESITSIIPKDPQRRGYDFANWYLDPYCKIEADLNTMPDHDLTVYAGWETGWYIVTIDPNYGALYEEEDGPGTGATWFWSSYEGDAIGEYRHTTRNYVESSSGTWYYVNHSGDGEGGDNGWPDRHTYYTQDPSKATEDTTFEYAPGTYTYAGWYEVNEDGSETPFDFGVHTDHNTVLRLHWKKTGTYYISYAAGNGTLDDGVTKDLLITDEYSDYANILLTRSANAPSGYTFVGWKVRGSDSNLIYKPGKVFVLHADDAKRVGGKNIVYLDAEYVKVGTASITYDANGGEIASAETYDLGYIYNAQGELVKLSGNVDTESDKATVKGIKNNSKIQLSGGTNFSYIKDGVSFTLVGWSNKELYDPDDLDAELYSLAGDYGVDKEEPTTLFAVWQTKVVWHLDENVAEWNGKESDGSWGSPYEYDSASSTHTFRIYLNNIVSEPTDVPKYKNTETDNRVFRYWAKRSGTGTEGDPYVYEQYDFSQSVTNQLDLYAVWSEPSTVAAHAVNASIEDLSSSDANKDSDWLKNGAVSISVGTAEISLADADDVKIYMKNDANPTGYAFDFAAVSSGFESISKNNKITAIKYDSTKKKICVKYATDDDYSVLEDGLEIYFVYYQEKKLSIGYKEMETSGALSDVTSSGAIETDVALGNYSMAEQLSDPLSLVTPDTYSYYAFAIGTEDTHGTPQMNASNLSLLTDAADEDDAVPTLRLRNTWRGYEYTLGTGDSSEWISCGYDPHLYVIYYTQQPTVIIFREETVGSNAVMNTEFVYDMKVEEIGTNGSVETVTTLFDTTEEGSEPFKLKNGEQQSAVLFYSSVEGGATTVQKITITQRTNDGFNTNVTSDSGTITQPNKWEYTSDGSGGTKTATFTNSHKSIPVEVHVALIENNGTDGNIIRRDSLRSVTASDYKFDLVLGESVTLLTKLPSTSVFKGDASHIKDDYAFGAILNGAGASVDGDAVTVKNMGVVTISYQQVEGNIYELVLKDSNGEILGELSNNDLYYFYYPKLKIQYVKENSDGSLTPITGCLENPVTGEIEPSDSVTYSHNLLEMNGMTVMNGQSIEIPLSGLTISQDGNNFRMPPVLDDGLSERYLNYSKIGAGNAGISSIDELDGNVSSELTMYLRIEDNSFQYSFDGTDWQNLPLSGIPTVYAIYSERGYDFMITKTVDISSSGEDAIFTDSTYEITISSLSITKDSYEADGTDSSTVPATPAEGSTPGTITLTVKDGTKIRIKSLGRGEYTVTESGNENYILTAKIGPIVGGTSSSIDVTDNTTVVFDLNSETKLDLTNTPKAICKIENHYFFTLQSMVNYVEEEITDKTAYVEMLTDYLMPAADTVEIPNGFHITLVTAEEGFDGTGPLSVITRTTELAGVPLFTNHGELIFRNIVLEGNNVPASAPMIQSSGNLTIGNSATIQNVKNSGNGGAINSTSGDITISGVIKDNSAKAGGAIYYTGNGILSVSGQGDIHNNSATENGGAIYMTGGTLALSGLSKIHENNSNEKGGAVYAESALITVENNASITSNTAADGGAIYIDSGSVVVSQSSGFNPPFITGNTANTGSGGAIYIGSGSVNIAGGVLSNNNAENGSGGAIYTDDSSITVTDKSELKNNKAKSGGVIFADTGTVTVSGGDFEKNTASEGDGGAICADNGLVYLSDKITMKDNTAISGNGGAVYATSIDVNFDDSAELSGNQAKNGGAIYAENGSIILSASTDETSGADVYPTIKNNKATTGNGGAILLTSGSISMSGGVLFQNEAKINGGAIYTGNASFTLSSIEGHIPPAVQGNKANDGNGGAIYSDSGAVTISAGTIGGTTNGQGNIAGQNGGVLYANTGTVTVGEVTMTGNIATSNGGTLYVGSGAVELNGSTMMNNSAQNGAAVFINAGRGTFNAGSYKNNVALQGGTVGIGTVDARLYFSGNVQITNNKLGDSEGAPSSNIYLDQDSDSILNIVELGSDANIGIYVPDSLETKRDVPGARFAVYTKDNNINKIINDRYGFSVQKDEDAKKLFWGSPIKVSICYMSSFNESFPPSSDPNSIKYYQLNEYYPEFNDAAISELANELFNKYGDNYKKDGQKMSGTAVYAGAYLDGETDFGEYLTKLTWDSTTSEWIVTKRNDSTKSLHKDGGDHRIYIYYSEPTYISIENNTDMLLDISDMTVHNYSVINDKFTIGYGMVFAKNGAIRSALLPVTKNDLQLAANTSITLLIPGGRNMAYTLDGDFTASQVLPSSVKLRRSGEVETQLPLSSDGKFDQLTGTTLSGSGTYSIIFGEDKIICKVVDKAGVEHPYTKISDAINAIIATESANPPYELTTPKTAVIEMVTDYLLPSSDPVNIPKGYDITLTTALSGTYQYHPDPEPEYAYRIIVQKAYSAEEIGDPAPDKTETDDDYGRTIYLFDTQEKAIAFANNHGLSNDVVLTTKRATISRDSENSSSMINSWNTAESGKASTILRINNLIFDGKSVRGNSDGGAVASLYTNVYINNVDFKNVYANNGGALLIMHVAKDKVNKVTVKDTVLEVKNASFVGCTSTTLEVSNRLGGGAIVTNAETMRLDTCVFDTCTAVDQAGAVFHRVDGNYDSYATITDCFFTNCRANAAGGLELNSKNINVSGTSFEHCYALERNGGGFNVWALNDSSGNPNNDCWVTVTSCSFNDCHVTELKNNTAGHGGGFRSNARYTTINDCTFTNCSTTRHGGGACISNTTAYDCIISGCTFDSCSASEHGGGVFSRANNTTINDYEYEEGKSPKNPLVGLYIYNDEGEIVGRHTEIKNCTAINFGGGVSQDRNGTFIMENATINNNTVTKSNDNYGRGGGVYTTAKKVEITGGSISNNTARNEGGGLFTNASTSLTITGTTVSENSSSNKSGGGIYYGPNSAASVLTLNSCTLDNNTATNGNGGGIYTNSGKITIGKDSESLVGTSIRNCWAKAGGGIYHDKNVEGTFLNLSDSVISGCHSTNGIGGGIRTNAWEVTIEGSDVKNNVSTGNGAGLWFDGANDANRNSMSLSINGSVLDGNTSGGNGGGVYTLIKTVNISSSDTKAASISNNTAIKGGGIYHDKNVEGSTLTVTGTADFNVLIKNNIANGSGTNGLGGGVYSNVQNVYFIFTDISGNRSNYNGGGICNLADSSDYSLNIDHTKVDGNSSGNQGGGIYTKSQLYLKNDSMITNNKLTGNTVENSAGVYLVNNRTVYVGSEDASSDSSSVKDNHTASGASSNLRLWWDGDKNHANSVNVLCDLTGKIYVVNAAKVGSQFGVSTKANPAGFGDDNPVFKADTSTLYGIIDRTDPDGIKIIWAGPPIAKITNGTNILYLKQGVDDEGNLIGINPAIFDRLYYGDEGVESIVGAFNVLNSETPTLYTANGTRYEGPDYYVEMLVENYVSDSLIYVKGVTGRNVVLTTADTTDETYPSEAKRSTITAGKISKSFFSPRGNFTIKNVVIDGANKVRTMWIQPKIVESTVILGENAIIQNGKADNGAGVYIKNADNGYPANLNIDGGIIRSCTSTSNGGAIYIASGELNFDSGYITGCTTAGSGGGVFFNTGTFNMTGGTINDCSAKKGGGILVPNNATSPFNMSGGRIINNIATETGGGIAVNGGNARIYFFNKVNVSGNKVKNNTKEYTCNLELNQDSNFIIRTKNGGLYSGSYIGVYVPDGTSLYDKHGKERKPFGTFDEGDNTINLYSFVNDRNGLKGGIIEKTDSAYIPNTIYWIQIFSLQITKKVESINDSENNEIFLFKVNVRGNPTVPGQLSPKDIDSSTGFYGEMKFTSNGVDTTTAVFALKDDEQITGINLSEGLDYEVIEYLIVSGGSEECNNQHIRYAAMPMNGYSPNTEHLTYDGVTYTVIRSNTYSSKIGENKSRTDVDPYTSAITFTNMLPICKITNMNNDLLYKRYIWKKTTNNPDDPEYYYAPAVYTDLIGNNGAFKALEGTFYTSNGSHPTSYSVSNGVQIQMLIGNYTLSEAITLPAAINGEVTLTTSSLSATLFPKQDAGTTSTIKRGFEGDSMFTIEGKLALKTIILDGDKDKGKYSANKNGGLINVSSGGMLAIKDNATLQNSRTSLAGGAIYVSGPSYDDRGNKVKNGGAVDITGGSIIKNESDGNGAGVYLEVGSTMKLSGSLNFGGTGLDVGGNIVKGNGNWKNESLTGKTNGGKEYIKPRQDIFIAGYQGTDGDTSADSLIIAGEISTEKPESIWVWAEKEPHYQSLQQFAKIEQGKTVSKDSLRSFRNAQDDVITGADQIGNRVLYGIMKSKDTVNVYWFGVEDSRRVILRKVASGSYKSLKGAKFDILYSPDSTTPAKDKDGNTLSGLTSDDDGVFYTGELIYGTYYVKEIVPPSGYSLPADGYYFIITVDENGVGYKYIEDGKEKINSEVSPTTS